MWLRRTFCSGCRHYTTRFYKTWNTFSPFWRIMYSGSFLHTRPKFNSVSWHYVSVTTSWMTWEITVNYNFDYVLHFDEVVLIFYRTTSLRLWVLGISKSFSLKHEMCQGHRSCLYNLPIPASQKFIYTSPSSLEHQEKRPPDY